MHFTVEQSDADLYSNDYKAMSRQSAEPTLVKLIFRRIICACVHANRGNSLPCLPSYVMY